MDLAERQSRQAHAESLRTDLAEKGVVAVATSFVDNAGIARVKAVPLSRLPELAAWGVGASTSFDVFRFDDVVVMPSTGEGPVGDSRIVPDLARLALLPTQRGWGWAPGDRYDQDGRPHEQCSRLLLRRIVDHLATEGLSVKTAIEIEWTVSSGEAEEFRPATTGPAYGLARITELSDYCRDVITALAAAGVEVEQFHPEYGAGQFEVSVAPSAPVDAADTSVLVRSVVRAVGHDHGLRTSYSPKVAQGGVGNGGHVHVSLWREGRNLMAGGPGLCGLTEEGAAFAGGILTRLPALLAIGAPGVASYLRLVPSYWAGAYACWGPENREAALRMVTGSVGSSETAANIEVKCFDLQANPYLLLAGLVAAGSTGLTDGAELPDPVVVDPAVLSADERTRLGVSRLPESLQDSVGSFLADDVLTEAFGAALVESIVAVRRSEIELFADASPEEVVAATRWAH
jgi:glutamine synthetase